MEKGPALPKNIRQIGEISGREKVCIEDYAMTWIRKRGQQEDKGYLGILFGEQQETEDSVYVFIRGVFEVPAEIQEPQQREAIRQEYEKYFGGWAVQGCCVVGVYPTERMKMLGEWIPESGKLIYHLQDQEETLYWTGEEQYRRLQGYFVFYEQNARMQEYLAELFRDDSVEKESAPDRAIRSFREKIKEKGEQRQSSFLRMASSFFVIAVLVIGAIVVNRVEDIRMARSLSSTGGSSLYGQEEGENTQNGSESSDSTAVWKVTGTTEFQNSEDVKVGLEASGSQESMSGTAAQTDLASGEGMAQDTAAMSAAQYNAIQQAAEEAALSGSDAFWEKADLEDVTERQEETETTAASGEQESSEASAGNADPVSVSMENADPVPASAENTDSAQASAGDSGSGEDAGQDVQEAQEAVASRHTQAGYVIKEGDTLAKICSRYYGTLDRIAEICEANGIEDANVILPGQRIVLP